MSNLTKIVLLNIAVISSLMLASCGGDGIGGTGYPHADTSVPTGSLYRSTESSLSSYFQKSIKKRINDDDQGNVAPTLGAGDTQKSSTNIQEAGVEEADLVKTNGRVIYSVTKTLNPVKDAINSTSLPYEPESFSGVIRLMEPEGNGLKEVKRFTNKDWNFTGLYLNESNDRLIALSSKNQNHYANWFNGSYFANQKTDVIFLDVKESKTASIQATLSFDGSLVSSRRNGDTLYMALRHFPDYKYIDDDKLSQTTSNDFLPSYSQDGGDRKLISNSNNCFLEKGRIDTADVITLIAVDLSAQTPKINSRCLVGSMEALYASQDSIYLATTRWDYQVEGGSSIYQSADISTDIHKFAYNGLDFDYRGSGEVSGHLGYKQDSKSFRFSESKDVLRVITFDEKQWENIQVLPVDDVQSKIGTTSRKTGKNKSPVSITLLKENPSKKSLEIISKLPNKDRTTPIGLPGERLYATRFIGDRAYIVTFRVVDPLYVLDLSNPSDPFIAGELKVDGYSDYLHPISENLLLGVGKDAVPDLEATDGRGAWYQGVKLSLIDVSSPSNPKEVDKVIIGMRGTETGVLFDHHAFTGLKVGNKYRVALPVVLHENIRPVQPMIAPLPSTYHDFKHLGLYRYEIDLDSQEITTIPAMVIQSDTSSPFYFNVGSDRSVFLDNNVHFMHDGQFWSQDWSGSEAMQGPK